MANKKQDKQEAPAPETKEEAAPLPTPDPVEPPAPRPKAPERSRVAKDTNFTNPSSIVWPTDRHGLTSRLKKEMISVASRVSGDPAKLKLLEETLDLLMKHVRARFEFTQDNVGGKLKPKVTHPPEVQ